MKTNSILIESDKSQLFTTIYPKQDAQTVILLHGGPGVPMDDSPIAEQLIQKYQVITFEQRGTGRSPSSGATYAIEEYINDINAIAQSFKLDKFHLFGHSWGGLYAQIYSEKHPARILSLFLSSPSSGTGEIWKQTQSEVMLFNRKHAGFGGWLRMGIKSLFGMLGSSLAYQSLFKQVIENYHRDFDAGFIANDDMVKNVRADPVNKTRQHITKYPLLKNMSDYDFPIIIVYGEKDIYGESKQYVKNRFPQAIFVEMRNAGHMAWKHAPEEFSRILVEFYKIS
jgi:proline iminopeptidase